MRLDSEVDDGWRVAEGGVTWGRLYRGWFVFAREDGMWSLSVLAFGHAENTTRFQWPTLFDAQRAAESRVDLLVSVLTP